MKNFLDDDDLSYDTEDEIEEVEKHDAFEHFEVEPENVKTTTQKMKKKFDEETFDSKVAKSIVNIHSKKNDDKYSKWVNNNYNHLQHLYHLSCTNVSEEVFYSYIYEHSQ